MWDLIHRYLMPSYLKSQVLLRGNFMLMIFKIILRVKSLNIPLRRVIMLQLHTASYESII